MTGTRKDWLSAWQSYQTNVKSFAESARKMIDQHRESVVTFQPFAINDIENTLESVKKINTIKTDLSKYEKWFHKKSLELGHRSEEIKAELVKIRKIILSIEFELHYILAQKYMRQKEQKKNLNERKILIKQAYDHVLDAMRIYKNNNDDNAFLKEQRLYIFSYFNHVESQYNSHFNVNLDDPVNKKLSLARCNRNKEEADTQFQQAYELALETNNIPAQFNILLERGMNLVDDLQNQRYSNQKTVVHKHREIFHQLCQFLITAAKMKLALDTIDGDILITCEAIISNLILSGASVCKLATMSCISFDLVLREALLKEAKEYYEWGIKLSEDIKRPFKTAAYFGMLIDDEIQKLESEKNRLNKAKLDKDLTHLNFENLRKAYDEKFDEILISFEEKKEAVASICNQASSSIAGAIAEAGSSTSSNEADAPISQSETSTFTKNGQGCAEEIEWQPIYTTLQDEQVQTFSSNPINLVEQNDQLSQAINSNDSLQQIKIHSYIADYHRIEAAYILRRSSTHNLSEAIDHLEKAKEALELATDLIHQTKSQSAQEITVESWMTDTLKATSILLKKLIERQEKIKERFDKSHVEAKSYIINKYGKAAWYKYKSFDWANLSENAKIRLLTKQNLERLIPIRDAIDQTLSEWNKEKKFILPATEELSKSKIPLIDPEARNKTSVAYFTQNLFTSGSKVLKRSESLESFFEPVSSAVRESNRKNFGR